MISARSGYYFHLLEVDSSGLMKWYTRLEGHFYRNEHLLYKNNRYLILYKNQDDIILTCLNESGNIQWSNNYGGTGIESASSISVLPSSDIFITGLTENWNGIRYEPSHSYYFIRTDKDGNICY